MVTSIRTLESPGAIAVNVELTRGRHGAAARVELRDRPSGRTALLELRGWIDLSAERRIEQVLDDLAARGVRGVLVDCSSLRHIDYRMVPRLVKSLARFESRAGGVAMCGLSRYLRDLFRLAGCDPHLEAWIPAAEGAAPAGRADGASGERAS